MREAPADHREVATTEQRYEKLLELGVRLQEEYLGNDEYDETGEDHEFDAAREMVITDLLQKRIALKLLVDPDLRTRSTNGKQLDADSAMIVETFRGHRRVAERDGYEETAALVREFGYELESHDDRDGEWRVWRKGLSFTFCRTPAPAARGLGPSRRVIRFAVYPPVTDQDKSPEPAAYHDQWYGVLVTDTDTQREVDRFLAVFG